MSINVKLDNKDFLKAFQFTEKARINLVPTAYRQALNRTIITVRKEATKQVRLEVNLKAKDVKRKMTIKKAKGNDINSLGASMTVKSRRLNMALFVKGTKKTPKPSQKGVAIGKRKPIRTSYLKGKSTIQPKAFLIRGANGNLTLVQHRTDSKTRLVALTAPSLKTLFNKPGFETPIIRVAHTKLRHNFDSAMTEQLRKAGAK